MTEFGGHGATETMPIKSCDKGVCFGDFCGDLCFGFCVDDEDDDIVEEDDKDALIGDEEEEEKEEEEDEDEDEDDDKDAFALAI
jgi:hypothetical protein